MYSQMRMLMPCSTVDNWDYPIQLHCFILFGSEHRTLSDEVGNVKLCKDHLGNEYLQMNERNTKTRTGADVKNKGEIPQITSQDVPSRPTSCVNPSVLQISAKLMIHSTFKKTLTQTSLSVGSNAR